MESVGQAGSRCRLVFTSGIKRMKEGGKGKDLFFRRVTGSY